MVLCQLFLLYQCTVFIRCNNQRYFRTIPANYFFQQIDRRKILSSRDSFFLFLEYFKQRSWNILNLPDVLPPLTTRRAEIFLSRFSRNDQKSVISETSHDERSSTSAPKKWMFSDKVGRSSPFRSVNDTLGDLSSSPVIVLDCLSMNRDPFGSFSNLSRRSISPVPVSSVFAEKFRQTMAKYVNERNNGTMRTQGC